ncbi:FHA domain-containing protein [Arthrobacter sp. zg-Y769]|nr:FHA domain-containing protein [Arthrobacter sp. zg-Y769]
MSTGALAADYLEGMFGAAVFSIEGCLLTQLEPGQPPFIGGCVILASPPGSVPPGRRQLPGQLFFVVSSGPDAGLVFALARGTYTIGRAGGGGRPREDAAEIRISDPALSRRHCELRVGRETIGVRDLRSANGTWVNGRRTPSARVDAGTELRFGYSLCRIAVSSGPQGSNTAATNALTEPLKVRTEDGQKSGMLLVGSLLPLVLGIVMALTTGMWIFLAFSTLSAVTGVLAAAGIRRRQKRNRAAVAAAVDTDIERRFRSAPDPGVLALRAFARPPDGNSAELPGTAGGGTGTQVRRTFPLLRIGLGDQPANVETVPGKPGFTPPMIPNAPVMLDLDQHPGVIVRGSAPEVGALARTVLLQLGGSSGTYPGLRFLCLGHEADLPLGIRFLPGAALLSMPFPPADSEAGLRRVRERVLSLLAESGTARDPAVVVCLLGAWAALRAPLEADLAQHTSGAVSVIGFGTGGAAQSVVTLSPGHGTKATEDASLVFCPDLVGVRPFERIARGLAAGTAGPARRPPRSLPQAVPFCSVVDTDPASVTARWREHARDASAAAPIGIGPSGVYDLDLDAHGPHFLAAGTTGSGKSEFLRSLVTALAACRSPSQINFLLIDFKGGSGLGPLHRLPHTVGLLTDLSAEHVARALVSLRAEVRRRERLFAQVGAEDLAGYNRSAPPDQALPRLLVIVDEFRMLADTVPTALPELFRIAAIGRSLGISLFLATQRPQGAVTSDIRANIASSVALRVQSAAESRDVIGTDAASLIPATLPGRAYVRIAGSAPMPFQALSTSLKPGTRPRPVRYFTDFLMSTSAPPRPPEAQDGLLDRICADIRSAAVTASCPVPRPPVAEPLPRHLDADGLRRCLPETHRADGLVLGLRDEPDDQCLKPLCWSPAADSHLAILGTTRAGAADGMDLIATLLLGTLPDHHLYILDGDGHLSWAAGAPQVGAYAHPGEVKRASRILRYLGEGTFLDAQGSDPSGTWAHSSARSVETTVLITGWGRWVSAFRASRREWAEDALFDLVRDGERGGIAVVVAGDRELISAAFFPSIPNRLYFPAEASAESLLRWPRLPAMEPVRGRALAMGRIAGEPGSVSQLVAPPAAAARKFSPLPPGCPLPHRVAALPQFLSGDELAGRLAAGSFPERPDRIPVGVSGDELDPAYVRVPPRSVFLVAGQAGSGRTAFLRQLLNGSPPSLECHFPLGGTVLEELCSRLTTEERDLSQVLLLIDDADLLGSRQHQQLAAVQARGARLVLAALSGHQISTRVPLAAHVRSAPRGALLQPSTGAEGEILGVRLALETRLPPGRCFLVEGTTVTEAQTAFQPAEETPSTSYRCP